MTKNNKELQSSSGVSIKHGLHELTKIISRGEKFCAELKFQRIVPNGNGKWDG